MTADPCTVIATFSRRMRICSANGVETDARIKGRKIRPVCGDRVTAAPIEGESDWLITAILERKNELRRPNSRGKVEVLAANIDRVVVVVAPVPAPDWFIVDRYICAAEAMHASVAIVFNKIEVKPGDDVASEMAGYETLGYEAVRTSAKTGQGVDKLEEIIGAETAILVGQSGVGKSSLINCLTDGTQLRTATVSGKSGEGRHTTVNSMMLPLDKHGWVVDSPGVRDYAPAFESIEEVKTGFREVFEIGQDCRFANCRHLREPDCAVKAAAADGRIRQRRYESYKRVVALTRRLIEGEK